MSGYYDHPEFEFDIDVDVKSDVDLDGNYGLPSLTGFSCNVG